MSIRPASNEIARFFARTVLLLHLFLCWPALQAQNQQEAARVAMGQAQSLSAEAAELESRGSYGEALSRRQQSLQILQQALGAGHPQTDNARFALANTLMTLGRYEPARDAYAVCLQVERQALGPTNSVVAAILNRIGETYRLQGLLTNSLPFYVEARRIIEPVRGAENLLATTLNNQALVETDLGNHVVAGELFGRCLDALKRAPQSNPILAAGPLSSLGELHRSQGRVADAKREQLQALDLVSNLPPASSMRLTVENNLASVLRDERLLPQAIQIYESSIAGLSRVRGPGDLDVIKMQRNQAQALAADRAQAAAQAIIEDCLSRLTATGRTNHPLYLGLLTDLGDSQQNLGDLTAAQGTFQTLMREALARGGPDDVFTCAAKERLATLAVARGDLATARQLLEEALASRQRNAGRDPARLLELASCRQDWARFARALGRADLAAESLQQAMEILRQRRGADHPELAEVIEQAGLLALERGNPSNALGLHTEACRIRTKAFGETNILVAQSRLNLAATLAQQTNLAAALTQAAAARATLEQLAGSDHPLTAMALFNEAGILHRLGRFTNAAPLYARALDTSERLHLRHTAIIARDYGLLEMERGRTDAAAKLAAHALATQEDLWQNVLRFGSEQDRLSWNGLTELLPLLAAIAPQDPAPLSTALLRLKGAVLDSLVEDRQFAQKSTDPQLTVPVTELGQARLRLYRLALSAAGQHPASEVELRKAREAVERLESRLASNFSTLADHRGALTASSKKIREALPPDTVLVEYVRYRCSLGEGRTEAHFGALLFQSNAPLSWLDLGPADGTNGIGAWVNRLGVSMRTRQPPAPEHLVATLQGLRERVWDKVAAKFEERPRWVIIAPDAELNFVPFAALWQSNRFLGEDLFFRYVTSARDLLVATSPPPARYTADIWADPQLERSSWQRAVETVAAGFKRLPTMRGAVGGALELLPQSYQTLPQARLEAVCVAQFAKSNGYASAESWVGPSARESTLRSRPPPHLLVLATHATFVHPPVLPPGEVLGSDWKRSPIGWNPMADAWVVLAGANETLTARRRGEPPDPVDDGLLTAEEISTLNLQGTWLVTLSACDTGVGAARAGEGVFGLRRGFALAGAQHLMLTLWPVWGEQTREMMEAFHADALKSKDPAGALARVQRAKLAAWRQNPEQAVKWAGPFVLTSHGL